MGDYIVLAKFQSPDYDGLVLRLAQAGWPVGVADTYDALLHYINRNGPPALVAFYADRLQPEEETLLRELRQTANTSLLSIRESQQNTTFRSVNRLRIDDIVAQPIDDADLASRICRLLLKRKLASNSTRQKSETKSRGSSKLVVAQPRHPSANLGRSPVLDPLEQLILDKATWCWGHSAYAVTIPQATPVTYIVMLNRRLLPV
jgi:DNA-binding response OmpR family regulator